MAVSVIKKAHDSTGTAVEFFLRQVVAQIEPTPGQKDGARRSHSHLRDLLNTGQMGQRILNSYLSGSYARDTAIRPLDDVDIIFEIDPSAWNAGLFSSLPPPERVLESFATAIRRRYQLSSVYGQRRSVRLQLNHLDIDIVPAVAQSADPTVILVPDRKTEDWIKSSPLRHSQNATRVNAKRDSKFKPLVKLLKFWNSNLPETVRCKSFMIETAAVRIFSETEFSTLIHGLVLFWDFLASRYGEPSIRRWPGRFGMSFSWLGVSVPDAAGTGSNTASSLDDTQARALATKARMSRDKLLAAYNAKVDDARERLVRDALRA